MIIISSAITIFVFKELSLNSVILQLFWVLERPGHQGCGLYCILNGGDWLFGVFQWSIGIEKYNSNLTLEKLY